MEITKCYSSGKDLIFLIYEICTYSIPYYLLILHNGLLKSEALLIVSVIGGNWVVAVGKVNPHTAILLIFIRLNHSNNIVLSPDNDFILINTANINAGVKSFLNYIIISLLSY